MNTEPTTNPVVERTIDDIVPYVRPDFGVALGRWIDRRVKEGNRRASVEERAGIFRTNILEAQRAYVRALDEAFDHGRSLGLVPAHRAEHAADHSRQERDRLSRLLLLLEQ